MSLLLNTLLALTALITLTHLPPSKLFALHPIAMTAALVLGIQGTLNLNRRRKNKKQQLKPQTREEAVDGHFNFMMMAVMLMGLGLLAIYQHKNHTNDPHFESLHSLLASTLLLLIIIMVLSGISFKSQIRPIIPWRLHRLAGYALLVGLTGVYYTGLDYMVEGASVWYARGVLGCTSAVLVTLL
ncbi:uncharacterized protein SPPG_08227 [Spizellomyces punctatus DAOM BR117]|uniref:Cytochrome b561 domain-containing protein n=1 Tax=Spizellomyces punctatus (strain DAOM BR117) TaxID=645134 RepID=A0A0L0H5X3_SPIPD|nr:uncharacterized protein SPPG_08227 [Spizellomyces punctatus DAOM BR117]KNC96321.1 hypothetical protein SPPG_08227 [Spizellomyces punctatus DAOM BR117]|eukprot:XP_016604361.1 hypothetical protein SPPG_08227 [Spizellomyces punctatus DAOM BR117]